MRPLYVLGPDLTKAEAAEIRGQLAEPGRDVYVCTAAAHTPGQRLNGDVMVVGNETVCPTIEADAVGKVRRFAGLDDLPRQKPKGEARGGAAAATPAAVTTAQGDAAAKPQPAGAELPAAAASSELREGFAAEPPLQDLLKVPATTLPPSKLPSEDLKRTNGPEPLPDLEPMDRSQLIKLAAERFPRAKPWATMGAPAIRGALTNLSRQG